MEEVVKGDASITIIRRLTSAFLQAMPIQVDQFESYMYLEVQRKPDKNIPDEEYGIGVRLNPCKLDWQRKTITAVIPFEINKGITSIDDLDPNWYEAVEAAFLSQIYNCLR